MPYCHPLALRERVVAHVEAGYSHRATASHFKVSVKFVNDMVKLKRLYGHLSPKPFSGRKGRGKLEPYKGWLQDKIARQSDITLAQLAHDLKERFDVDVHYWTVGRFLHGLGYSHKKRQFRRANNSEAM